MNQNSGLPSPDSVLVQKGYKLFGNWYPGS